MMKPFAFYLCLVAATQWACGADAESTTSQEGQPLEPLSDGATCALDGECSSGLCAKLYLDEDHDGYGSSSRIQKCVEPDDDLPPFGFSFEGGDCCDVGGDAWLEAARVFPAQTRTFDTPQTACSMIDPYDYNCNGVIDADVRRIPRTEFEELCSSSFPACDMYGVAATFEEIPCGVAYAAPFCAPLEGVAGALCIVALGPLTPPLLCN